jgi:hypothetical protein
MDGELIGHIYNAIEYTDNAYVLWWQPPDAK